MDEASRQPRRQYPGKTITQGKAEGTPAPRKGTQDAPRETGPPPESAQRHRPPALWCALHLPDCPSQERLEAAAVHCQQVSDYISLLPPDTIVFEAGSSLRYFRGIHPLRRHLANLLQTTPDIPEQHWHLSATPAAAASALLARAGRQQLVADPAGLRAALGPLPVDCLALPVRTRKRLHHSGLLYLRDLWRLPGGALRQRLGRDLSEHLERCLGRRPWPLARWQPPLYFHRYRESDWPTGDHNTLLMECEELLQELHTFLQRHGQALEQLRFHLYQESGQHRTVTLTSRSPSRSPADWQQLLAIRLEGTPLEASVAGVALEACDFIASPPRSAELDSSTEPPSDSRHGAAWEQTLGLLAARLGEHALCRPVLQDSRIPEHAGREIPDPHEMTHANKIDHWLLQPARPAWLLNPPEPLPVRDGTPWRQGPLQLLSGPERLQTGWWREEPLLRDYYVAVNPRGQRLWIFRRPGKKKYWYLHGLFG